MEESKKEQTGSGFWVGLVVGVIFTGLAVYLLDKEGKGNLVETLKKDLGKALEKIDRLSSRKGVVSEMDEEDKKEITTPEKKSSENKLKKFFRKNGRNLG